MSNEEAAVIDSPALTNDFMSKRNKRGTKVINPNTDKTSFGRIPKNNNGIPEGEIYLKVGIIGHGPTRTGAFGARHIWEKHKVDLKISQSTNVPAIIASILEEGVDVLVNFQASHSPARAIVLNTNIGRVALKQEQDKNGRFSYTIISAYGNKNAPGTVIGTLESPSN
ncbi:hypothetical protein [uncultured Vibrio sp.]|uniref:hypothetical protein n=1 Tax=uncultured Vibrio sp. TaxID=114054 RepID=UPI00262B3A8E|nr:hypothetical protein [uncultured Vibrio sp.]